MKKDNLSKEMSERTEGVFKIGKRYMVRVKNYNGKIISLKAFTKKADAEKCFKECEDKEFKTKWKL
jgi:hypothetical protein